MTPYDLAQRFIGEITELPGDAQHPFIQWAHQLCGLGHNQPDEVPWCSSFMNAVHWLCRKARSKSAAARSWLNVGIAVELQAAQVGDVIVLSRGSSSWQGHVGFYAGTSGDLVHVLGGNQANAVNVQAFPKDRIVGIRRIL